MNIFKRAESMMTMTEESWARHSNPVSVYSRFSCLPLLSISIWLRSYIGYYCLIPIAFSLFWIWYNPRAFRAPSSTNNWASKGTFGERIFLMKESVTIPGHHLKMANILSWLSGLGLPVLIYGLFASDLWIITFGNFLVVFPKAWFVDRMVWIYEDMKDSSSEFKNWLKT